MNRIILTGNLTADPELRALPDGEPVCKLRLAVDGMAPGHETGYMNVACFGNGGEAAARVLTKGWRIAVDGRLQHHRWVAKDGSNRSDYEVVGRVEFLSAPRDREPAAAPTSAPDALATPLAEPTTTLAAPLPDASAEGGE